MNQRIYYLDAMRGVLMILGVVLHSAQVFNPRQEWLLYSQKSTVLAPILIDAIHLFRMPAFFIISGYFAVLTLRKYGSSKFLKVRIQRIIIPLLVTAITLNSLQTYLLSKFNWLDFYLKEYFLNGEWVSHLWFLINLVFYFIFAFILVKVFKNRVYRWLKYIDKIIYKVPFIIIMLLLPFVVIGFLAIGKIYTMKGIIDSSALLLYLPFFLFGMLLQGHKGLLVKFTELSPLVSFFMIVLGLYIVNCLSQYDGFIWFLIKFYFIALGMWFSASLCFYIFKRFADNYSKIFMYLSDASYSVYLFHHVFVIAVGLLFIHYDIGGIVGMFLLMFIVGTVSLLIHLLLISKINILSFLFNGKALKRQSIKS